MNKNKNNAGWNKALRAAIFATLLTGSAIAALMPGWAVTLKAQGYVGYVDLKLDVQPSTPTLPAGGAADLLITLSNAGPADAARARTLALIEGAPVRKQSSGCREDPLGYPDCELSSPLPAGATADYLLALNLSPLARGTLNIAVAATSDDVEAAPGQELAFLRLPIEAHVDLQSNASCAQVAVMKNVPVQCVVTLGNGGPAAVVAPFFSLYSIGATMSLLSCDAPRPELCPLSASGWSTAMLLPGEALTLTLELTMDPNFYADDIALNTGVFLTSGNEIDDTSTNFRELDVPISLFRDGFEASPTAPAP